MVDLSDLRKKDLDVHMRLLLKMKLDSSRQL